MLIPEDKAALLPTELPPPLKLKAPPANGIGGKIVAEEGAELALNGLPLPNDDDEAALLIPEDEAALLQKKNTAPGRDLRACVHSGAFERCFLTKAKRSARRPSRKRECFFP